MENQIENKWSGLTRVCGAQSKKPQLCHNFFFFTTTPKLCPNLFFFYNQTKVVPQFVLFFQPNQSCAPICSFFQPNQSCTPICSFCKTKCTAQRPSLQVCKKIHRYIIVTWSCLSGLFFPCGYDQRVLTYYLAWPDLVPLEVAPNRSKDEKCGHNLFNILTQQQLSILLSMSD